MGEADQQMRCAAVSSVREHPKRIIQDLKKLHGADSVPRRLRFVLIIELELTYVQGH
ncbi:MAG: hypothetical protein ACLP01_25145 [Solirubrobacteraceae bacterium]